MTTRSYRSARLSVPSSRADARSYSSTVATRSASARTSSTSPRIRPRFRRPERFRTSAVAGRSPSSATASKSLDLFPVEPQMRGLAPVPGVGVRECGARPCVATERCHAPCCAVARAPADALRRIDEARRAAQPRAGQQAPGARCRPALQARRDQLVDARADPRAGHDRIGRLDRLQGYLPGHQRRSACRSRALPPGRRGVPGRLARGSRLERPGGRRGAVGRNMRASPGTRRSIRSRTSRRCRSPRAWSISSPRGSARCQASARSYDYCTEHGIGAYGGGQTELSVGRGQAQYLAALFHADAPNDLAPSAYNQVDPPAGLPSSPLTAVFDEPGFRWPGDSATDVPV